MSSDKKAKSYPRALPHRLPDEAAPAPGRVQPSEETPAPAQSGKLLIAVACLLALLAVTPYFWTRLRPLDLPPTPASNSPAAITDIPAVAPVPVPVAPAVAASQEGAEEPVIAPLNSAVSPPRFARERYLETLGSLTAIHLYQSYLNIGLLADAVEHEQMDQADAERTLGQIVRLMTLVDRQLDGIARTGLDANDQRAMQNIRKLTETLQTQADSLRTYWTTGELEQAARFHEARMQAWSGISEMLGLEDTDDR